MKKNDAITFNFTLKATNEVYDYMLNWIRSYPDDIEVISDKILADTQELYDNDATFKKLVKNSKDADRIKLDYINKHNK